MFLITVYDTKNKKIGKEIYKVVLDKVSTEKISLLRVYKKQFLKQYAGKTIITKQRTAKGWVEINI